MRNRTVPYSTGISFCTQTSSMTPARSDSISFMIFMASMMHRTWPALTVVPTAVKGEPPGGLPAKRGRHMGEVMSLNLDAPAAGTAAAGPADDAGSAVEDAGAAAG